MVGTRLRSLFVYSDVGGSSVVGNQVTDLLREVNFRRKGEGVQYFEPLHIQYIPLCKQVYFNQPDLFLNGVAIHGRLTTAEVKVKLYFYQVRINPSIYRELMETMDSVKVVSYAMVRSENLQYARRSAAF